MWRGMIPAFVPNPIRRQINIMFLEKWGITSAAFVISKDPVYEYMVKKAVAI